MKKFFALTLMAGLTAITPAFGVLAKPDWQHFKANYEVPVEDAPDLAEFALYEIPDIRIRESAGHMELKYELPDHLVGPDLGSITFEGTPDNLTSPFGKAVCVKNQCELHYNEKLSNVLQARMPEIEALLNSEFDPAVAAKKIEIAKRFAGDPIGIIHYEEVKFNY